MDPNHATIRPFSVTRPEFPEFFDKEHGRLTFRHEWTVGNRSLYVMILPPFCVPIEINAEFREQYRTRMLDFEDEKGIAGRDSLFLWDFTSVEGFYNIRRVIVEYDKNRFDKYFHNYTSEIADTRQTFTHRFKEAVGWTEKSMELWEKIMGLIFKFI